MKCLCAGPKDTGKNDTDDLRACPASRSFSRKSGYMKRGEKCGNRIEPEKWADALLAQYDKVKPERKFLCF